MSRQFKIGISSVAIGLAALTAVGTGTAHADPVPPNRTITVQNLGHATADDFIAEHGNSCDAANDGWHFIINGLQSPTSVDATDLPPTIDVAFSDAHTHTASFAKLNGSTAHYLNDTDHQSDGVYPTNATLVLPPASDVTEYGNFVLSHIPCQFNPTTTTTTTAPTTTTTPTTAPTTTTTTTTPTTATTTTTPATTEPATTSTTTAPTLTTTTTTTPIAPTTTAAGGAPTTTTPTASTSPEPVSVLAPTPPPAAITLAPFVTFAPGAVLPATGSTTTATLLIGIGFVLAGTTTIVAARTRRS